MPSGLKLLLGALLAVEAVKLWKLYQLYRSDMFVTLSTYVNEHIIQAIMDIVSLFLTICGCVPLFQFRCEIGTSKMRVLCIDRE